MRKIKDIDKRQGIKKNDMCMIGKKWGQNLQRNKNPSETGSALLDNSSVPIYDAK